MSTQFAEEKCEFSEIRMEVYVTEGRGSFDSGEWELIVSVTLAV